MRNYFCMSTLTVRFGTIVPSLHHRALKEVIAGTDGRVD